MRKWLIFFVVLSLQAAHAVPVWTWVDANGQVHYSDTPVPGARQIELTGAQGFSVPRPESRSTAAAPQPDAAAAYQTFNVASPGPQETLWNIGGNLTVLVELAPGLMPTHRLDVLLDGQRAQLNTNRLQFTLPNVFRGQHTLQAVIVGADGRVLQTSPPVSFVVQQTSVQNPNSLPAQRRAAPNAN
jgi:hypothetical protein